MPTAVGEECGYGKWECTHGASCHLPADGGFQGTCGCETMYGFSGPRCDKVSGAGWMMVALCAISLMFACYVIAVHISVGRDMHASRKMKFDALGRTLISSILLTSSVVLTDLCAITTVKAVCPPPT